MLTAAHCLFGLNIISLIVYAGTIYNGLNSQSQQTSLMVHCFKYRLYSPFMQLKTNYLIIIVILCLQTGFVIHPLYSDTTYFHDLAIITLNTPFTFNENVSAIQYAGPSYGMYPYFPAGGLLCTTGGWGATVAGNSSIIKL